MTLTIQHQHMLLVAARAKARCHITACRTGACVLPCPAALAHALHVAALLTSHISKRDTWRVGTASLCSACPIPAVNQPLCQEEQRNEWNPQRQHSEQHVLQLLLEGRTHHTVLNTYTAAGAAARCVSRITRKRPGCEGNKHMPAPAVNALRQDVATDSRVSCQGIIMHSMSWPPGMLLQQMCARTPLLPAHHKPKRPAARMAHGKLCLLQGSDNALT